jgi:hypothetical protein
MPAGLDHPHHAGAAAARRPTLLVLLFLISMLQPTPAVAASPLATSRRGLPPWVARTRGGGAADEEGEGGPAGVLRKEEFALVDQGDRYRGRWRSILKVLCALESFALPPLLSLCVRTESEAQAHWLAL